MVCSNCWRNCAVLQPTPQERMRTFLGERVALMEPQGGAATQGYQWQLLLKIMNTVCAQANVAFAQRVCLIMSDVAWKTIRERCPAARNLAKNIVRVISAVLGVDDC